MRTMMLRDRHTQAHIHRNGQAYGYKRYLADFPKKYIYYVTVGSVTALRIESTHPPRGKYDKKVID